MPATVATSRVAAEPSAAGGGSAGKGPPYAVRVTSALSALPTRTGASLPAITGYLSTNYGPVNKPALAAALRKGVEDETLVKIRASYKLGAKAKKPSPVKKTTASATQKSSPPAADKARKVSTKKAASTASSAAHKPKKAIAKKITAAPAKKTAAAPAKSKTESTKKAAAPKAKTATVKSKASKPNPKRKAKK